MYQMDVYDPNMTNKMLSEYLFFRMWWQELKFSNDYNFLRKAFRVHINIKFFLLILMSKHTIL
jgi:hypothetical protein